MCTGIGCFFDSSVHLLSVVRGSLSNPTFTCTAANAKSCDDQRQESACPRSEPRVVSLDRRRIQKIQSKEPFLPSIKRHVLASSPKAPPADLLVQSTICLRPRPRASCLTFSP